MKGGIGIPGLDSLLAGFSTGTVVEGLNDVPEDLQPPSPTLIHLSFDAMVGIGTLLALLAVWFAISWWRKRDIPENRWFLRIAAASGVLSVLALEAGWIVTEVGRQPWIVSGYMKVEEAVTDAQGIWWVFALTMLIYLSLAVITGYVRGLGQRPDEEAPAGDIPYAPRPGRRPDEQGRRRRGDLWIGVTLYAVFGGADFGGGMWDLLAGKTDRGSRARRLIDHSIAPVWEANHVWLIFVLVVLWTFPKVFSAIFTTLYIPLALAALGIVLGGRDSRSATRSRTPPTGHRVFGISSVLTPFFLGTVVGAVASGEVPADGGGDPTASWTGILPLLTGVMFVAVAAYVAAVFLVHDARAAEDEDLQDYFRDRAFVMAVIGGVAAVAGIFALNEHAEYVYDGLSPWPGIVLVIGSGICGLVALVLLVTRRFLSWGRDRPRSAPWSP